MVIPILNKTKVKLRKITRLENEPDLKDSRYREHRIHKAKDPEIEINGQVSDRQMEERNITRIGRNPQSDQYIIFNIGDFELAGLIGNPDENDDLRAGDIVVGYEFYPGKFKTLNGKITEVRPESPDFFSGENKFLLIYVFFETDTERRGTTV